MSRSLSVVLLTLALTGCTAESTPPTVATLSGTITARSFSAPTATHYGWILVAAGPACEQQIAFGIASDTRLVRFDGTTVSTDSPTARGDSRTCRIRGEHRVPVDRVGGFTLLLPAGQHHVCAEAIGFISRAGIVVLPRDSSRVLTLSMPWKPIPLGY